MSKLLYGSICLTDIPKHLITKSEKNGKSYLNIAISERKAVGQYGETHTISVSVSKDQRTPDDKTIYIGNLKTWEGNSNSNTQQQLAAPQIAEDDLPF